MRRRLFLRMTRTAMIGIATGPLLIGIQMRAWGRVNRAQEASTSRSVWEGVYTEEQAKRGEEAYRKEWASCHGGTRGVVGEGVSAEEQAKRGEEAYRKECASCHGDTLVGGGGAAPLTGGTF